MTNNVEAVARRLIPMERERLTGWRGPMGAAYNAISEDLCEVGLLNHDGSLTPLGQQVRTCLVGAVEMPEDIPQWALEEAHKQLTAGGHRFDRTSHAVRVHARMIAKHEKPPVDPDEGALERILKAVGVRRAYGREEWYDALAQYKKEIGRDAV